MSITQLARTPGEVRALLEAALSDGAPWFQLPTATIAAILSSLDAKEAQLAEAGAVLKLVEWRGAYGLGTTGESACPACFKRPNEGHAPGCRLAKVLRDET